MRFLLAIPLLLLAHMGTATAQSFKCARASTLVEQVICADDGLRQKDESLGELYRVARARLPNDRRLVESQRAWLQARDACARQTGRAALLDCLNDAYDERQDYLSLVAGR